jgi:3-oxoadipate enol-lactonase
LLPRINKPVLIITGSADTAIPPEDSRSMAVQIPGSMLVSMPGAAHLTNVEAADRFNSEVVNFLDEL